VGPRDSHAVIRISVITYRQSATSSRPIGQGGTDGH